MICAAVDAVLGSSAPARATRSTRERRPADGRRRRPARPRRRGRVSRLAPDAPVPVVDHDHTAVRPGGAGLAAVLAARGRPRGAAGHARSRDDAAGRSSPRLLAERGVEVVDLGLDGATPEKIRVRAGGKSAAAARPRRTARGIVGAATAAARAAIERADALLVADYGRGVAAAEGLRVALAERPRRAAGLGSASARRRPVPGALARHPQRRARLAAVRDAGRPAAMARTPRRAPRRAACASRWRRAGVLVTRGAGGRAARGGDGRRGRHPAAGGAAPATRAARATGSPPRARRARRPVARPRGGRGRRRRRLGVRGRGRRGGRARHRGRRGRAARPDRRTRRRWSRRVRAAGGTVVATGGCFDLLHAGHVAHAAGRARAGGLPGRLPELRRLRAAPEGAAAAAGRAGRPRRGPAGARLRRCREIFDEDDAGRGTRAPAPRPLGQGRRLRRRANCPKPPSLASWGGRASSCPSWRGAPPPV